MRIPSLLVLALALVANLVGCSPAVCDPNLPFGTAGSCPDPNAAAGTEGGVCKSGYLVEACDGDNLTCVIDACIECGGINDICCGNKRCDQGGCDTSVDPYNKCVADCGYLGGPCCPNDGCTQGTCNQSSNTCQTATAACDGENWYIFAQIDAWGCMFGRENELIGVSADTLEEAQECAAAQLIPGLHLSPPNENIDCEDVCITSNLGSYGTTTLCAFSAAEMATCKDKQCTTDDEFCIVQDNACPP